MTETIKAIFDGTVFRPEQKVELKPNTSVEITVTLKDEKETAKPFQVRSKHLGFRKDLDYDKISSLIETVKKIGKSLRWMLMFIILLVTSKNSQV